MRVSQRFITALKLSTRPAYQIAWEVGLHPSLLSKLLHGIERIKPNDKRIVAVGEILGLEAEECFETSEALRIGKGGQDG